MSQAVDLATELKQLIYSMAGPFTKTRRSLLGFTASPFGGLAVTLCRRSAQLLDAIGDTLPQSKIRPIIDDLRGQIMVSQTTDVLTAETAQRALNLLDSIEEKI